MVRIHLPMQEMQDSIPEDIQSPRGDPGSIPRLGRHHLLNERDHNHHMDKLISIETKFKNDIFLKSMYGTYGVPHGIPRCNSDKESACQCWRRHRQSFDPWVGKIPLSKKWQPAPVFLPEKFHGQRSLVGFSPWGHRELDTTEHIAYD